MSNTTHAFLTETAEAGATFARAFLTDMIAEGSCDPIEYMTTGNVPDTERDTWALRGRKEHDIPTEEVMTSWCHGYNLETAKHAA